MDSVKIGKYLAELRKSYKVTQDELALRLGVSRQAVSRWETGSSVPDVELMLKISELYGITIDAILHTDVSTLKGALMARGSKEVGRLIGAMGGKEHSAYGLCHLGDYEATLFSKHSQNRCYGEAIVIGKWSGCLAVV